MRKKDEALTKFLKVQILVVAARAIRCGCEMERAGAIGFRNVELGEAVSVFAEFQPFGK